MKKKLYQFILPCMLVSVTLSSHAATNADTKDDDVIKAKVATMTEAQKEARIEEIKARIEEIKTMDKSKLSKEDRKELRKELRSMQKEARAKGHGGVYISVTAAVIIILVLILVL